MNVFDLLWGRETWRKGEGKCEGAKGLRRVEMRTRITTLASDWSARRMER